LKQNISEKFPSTILRTHENAILVLDLMKKKEKLLNYDKQYYQNKKQELITKIKFFFIFFNYFIIRIIIR